MSTYTPTAEEMRDFVTGYAHDLNIIYGMHADEVERISRGLGDYFDRWLTGEIRKAKAEALTEAANDVYDTAIGTEIAHWLRGLAQQLKEES